MQLKKRGSEAGTSNVSLPAVVAPAVAALIVVVTAALAARIALPPLICCAATQLKPYHPNHRMKVPTVWNTGDCCGISGM